jgi:hypothetical protein
MVGSTRASSMEKLSILLPKAKSERAFGKMANASAIGQMSIKLDYQYTNESR